MQNDPADTLFPEGYGEDECAGPVDAPLTLDPQDLTPIERWPELTEREIEVAQAVAHGLDKHEIAKSMGISLKTFDTHRGHVLKKLGLRNVAQLTLVAVRRGAVTP